MDVRILLLISLFFSVNLLANYKAHGSPPRSLSLMEAVALTLKNQLDIKLAIEEINFSQGVLQQSAGPFDPIVKADETATIRLDDQNWSTPQKTHHTGYDAHVLASASKKTRLGTIYSLDIDLERLYDPALFPFHEMYTKLITFRVVQPLLRGFRYGIDTMVEKANQAELEATYYDTLQIISQRIYDTTFAYWEMSAAKKTQEILLDTVKRFEKIIADTKRLIQEDQLAKADIVQPQAQLATKLIDLQTSQQAFFRTFEDLKFAMNVVEEIPCAKEEQLITDEFKDQPFSEEEFNKISCYLLERAANSRFDIIANQKRKIAAEYLVKGAENETYPQLDLFGGAAYKNYSAHVRASTGGNNRGPAEKDIIVGINFSMPFYNDRARGLLKQQLARESQLQLQRHQLIQSSLRDLRTALKNQIRLANNLKEALEAVKENHLLVENERKKIQAGFSTIFFLIDFENRLTDSLIQQVLIYKQFYQNIALIRFLSATLFMIDDGLDTITPENLTSLNFNNLFDR